MPNQLQHEPSLYLQQHSENPVDWHPWGAEALALAESQNKPLLVSIGYSSCHWCHVMAHESFEDDYIAGLMNRHFICIKVDREERPDLDHVFMEAVQMIAHHGGWPLNVFCFPDGRPFFGGTYFPPEDRGNGMIPWPQLLMRIADYYTNRREDLEENAKNLVHNLMASNYPKVEEGDPFHRPMLLNAAAMLMESHDDANGGWGGEGPKFPHTSAWLFLSRVRAWGKSLLPRYEETDERNAQNEESWKQLVGRLDTVMNKTLESLGRRGLYDQVGGGFFRYCVDTEWKIPHFEKMLYDNGLLLETLVWAYAQTRLPWCREQVEETIGWLQREMQSPRGGFAASLDADSEEGEGAFYVWTAEEIQAVLGERAENFIRAWELSENNFEGKAIHLHYPPSVGEERSPWKQDLEALFAARSERTSPARDDKVLLSWNTLVIKGLIQAAYLFQRPEWFALAEKQTTFLVEKLKDDQGEWHSVYYDRPGPTAYLDDVAHLADALLMLDQYGSLFGSCGDRWLKLAQEVAEYARAEYRDEHESGYFFAPGNQPSPVVRKKEFWDGALPAGNSVLLGVFHRLWVLTGESVWNDEWMNLMRLYPSFAQKVPQAIPHALSQWTEALVEPIVITAGRDTDWKSLHQWLATKVIYPVLFRQNEEVPAGFEFCRGNRCLGSTLSSEEVIKQLQLAFD